MTRCMINQLSPGMTVSDQVFMIRTRDLRTTSNGSSYIHMVLCDRTGDMPGRMWQASESDYLQIPEGGFLRFAGRVESYRGNLQFIVEGFRPVDMGAIDLGDFIPHTPHDVEAMWKRIVEILRKIKDPDLLMLVKQFVTDAEFVEQFKKAPAAMVRHHAYIGGLAEHTLSMMELVLLIAPRYPRLNMDLTLAGAFLHDIGKIAELRAEAGFTYTDDGQLVGHIVRCVVWIEQRIAAAEAETGQPFPAQLKSVLQHIIVSHHGTLEFGSPKLPAVAEAMALHYLDNLDAKLHQVFAQIDKDPDAASDWTPYTPALGTRLFKTESLNAQSDDADE